MNFSIAIDGPSGAGKSTLSKKLAEHIGFIHVDTGAIYRTVGLFCLKNSINCKDEKSVEKALENIEIEIKHDEAGVQKMFLNGEDVSKEIRQPEVSLAASDVSALPSVREFLLEMQRSFASENSVILDGRDIGTVVLPNADCKIYLTASAEVRAQRRLLELEQRGEHQDFNKVLRDIEYRDYQDSHRETAPLRMSEDAVLLDTSELDFDQSFKALCNIVNKKIGKK